LKANSVESFVTQWIDGTLGKQTQYRTTPKNRYYISNDGVRLLYEGIKDPYSYWRSQHEHGSDVLAIRLKDGRILGNAARLKYCESHTGAVIKTCQQVLIDKGVAMVPFNVFVEAGLDLSKTEVIEHGGEEKIDILRPGRSYNSSEILNEEGLQKRMSEPKLKCRKSDYIHCKANNKYYLKAQIDFGRHYIGAMLLKVDKKTYLIDIDRGELPYYRMNPFVVEVKDGVKTISAAYDSLIPASVRRAQKQGLKVVRQGEWFFIPSNIKDEDTWKKRLPKRLADASSLPRGYEYGITVPHSYHSGCQLVDIKADSERILDPAHRKLFKVLATAYNKRAKNYNKYREKYRKLEQSDKIPRRGDLRAGNNRPNRVDKMFKYNGKTYVQGSVEHSGREHEPIVLKGWHIPVPNTGINSFTISGDID